MLMSTWKSIEMAVAIPSSFFLFLGGAFVAICAFYDDRVEGPLKGIRPYSRFLCFSFLAIFLNIGLILGCLVIFGDESDSPGYVPAFMEKAAILPLQIINGPLAAAAYLLRGNPFDSPLPFVVLFFSQGFFWGFIAEMLFRAGARLRSKAVTKST
jgi:hypothetical protein